ncbi:MAG: aldehyde oxidase [Acidobacteria bacterium]|nr:aldehyde oxidase [Acidobacteriota bacterium]
MSARGLQPALDRRQLLASGLAAGAGLVIGLRFPRAAGAAADVAPAAAELNAFVRIGSDDTVTVLSKHVEFGQGTYTGLATLLAEELDADWATVRVVAAPADVERYKNLFFGVQGTGGSTAMANSWEQMRRAGATARALLVAAAAATWSVPAAELSVAQGVVRHAASGRSARFGELAARAAELEPPAEVALKDPKQFVLVGREDLPRVDVPEKSRGAARFALDFTLPGLRTALIARPPRFGARVRGFDASEARRVPGVVDVVQIPQGVAVLAEGFWAAKRGRDALRVDWDESGAETRGTVELVAEYRGLLARPGLVARSDGDAEAALAGAARVVSAEYEFPYLAHAPMEPLDCVIRVSEGRCELWTGAQLQTVDQAVAAEVLGLEPSRVAIETMLAGGSFGRRATPQGDLVREAAEIAKAIRGAYPVKLVWTRDDDLRGGRYRPLYLHRLEAGLDAEGRIVGWTHRIVGQSLLTGTPFESFSVKDGIDESSVEGAKQLPYAIPNLRVDLHTTKVGVPVLWWRSVGHTQNGYATEAFFDEVARAAGRDPFELRRELLSDHPRHRGVLELAAEKAGWGRPLPAGRARGIAVHASFSSFVAQVAEVSLDEGGMPRVHRVVCAVDCGVAINPDNVRAQMEGGIGFGLGTVLHDEVTLEAGRVVQSNFHDYPLLRIHEMPEVEVHIVRSTEAPTGVGEPGVPPIGPAVANAVLALTGRPARRLPFRRAVAGS